MGKSRAIWVVVAICACCGGCLSVPFFVGGMIGDPIPSPKEAHDAAVAGASRMMLAAFLFGSCMLALLVYAVVRATTVPKDKGNP